MKICILADLHLPYDKTAIQYDALEFALNDALKKGAELLIFAGDQTADGNRETADYLINRLSETEVPYLIIAGNSDYRKDELIFEESPVVNEFDGFKIFMLHDGRRTLTENELEALSGANENDFVFFHHPYSALKEPWKTEFIKWKAFHPETRIFYAHLHKFSVSENETALPSLDPDKNIGESPCVLYLDTETGKTEKAYYFCPMPVRFLENSGISCYKTIESIKYSAAHALSCIEIRTKAYNENREELVAALTEWRNAGGRNLSIHFPNISYKNGQLEGVDDIMNFVAFAREIGADRITVHVPKNDTHEIYDSNALGKLVDFYAEFINALPENITVGIENLHMTEANRQNGTRPFGCIPSEIKDFCEAVRAKTSRNVGINLDLGHARNNAPYSVENTLSVWYAQLGKMCVGYHVHQVNEHEGMFENHTPITEHYGRLISLASFYKNMSKGVLNNAPIIFEVKIDGGAAKTVEFFKNEQEYTIHDVHSHTYYSNCGRDEPQKLIDTAIENGISVLGICDHSYGIGERKKEYLEEMRSFAQINKAKIKIICGIEIPSLPKHFDFSDMDFSVISEYDYCLLEHITEADSIIAANLIEFTEKIPIPCGIAHTDLFAYCKMYGFDPLSYFKELVKRSIFWELNMSYDSIHHYKKHEYAERFFKNEYEQEIVKKSGLMLCVGFDSHRHEDYDGSRVHFANRFLKDNNFRTIEGFLFD